MDQHSESNNLQRDKYLADFLAANRGSRKEKGLVLWKLKLKTGNLEYADEDLKCMSASHHLELRFREVLLDGKWIANTNFKDSLADVTLLEANTKLGNLNTIAALIFHVNYYVEGVLEVLKGGDLLIRDAYSFDAPELTDASDWRDRVDRLMQNAEAFAQAIELLPDEQLAEAFVDEKYGTYRRNLEGMIEHCYYHLGQISLLKKLIRAR